MNLLGIDLGGTNARAALVSEDGRILASVKQPLISREPAAVVSVVAATAKAALAAGGPDAALCRSCGVGVAGQLDGATGFVSVAPNLGWRNVDFGGMLATALGFPVRVVNDLSAAAWGELCEGAGKGAQDLFVVFIGSGVGSALISGGRLISGATGVAGEFGHIKVVPGGRKCGCGELGCLEAYAGGHNLIAQIKELIDGGASPLLRELSARAFGGLHPGLLEEAAKQGDHASHQLYERVRGFLALAVANQVTVLNPKRVILGGGVLLNCPGFRDGIVEGIEQYSSWVSRKEVEVVDAALGDDSGIIGAALMSRG